MKFSSKAKTLEKLYENLTTANVADVVYFTVGEWLNEKKKCRPFPNTSNLNDQDLYG